MNYVLVDGSNAVVLRSAAPIEGVPAGFTAFETEDWPMPGMIRADDGTFQSPPLPDAPVLSVPKTLEARLAELAAIRFEHEQAGTTVGGIEIATDSDTQAKLTAAYLRAQGDPDLVVDWKVGPGEFVQLDAAQIIAIGNAAADHVQACYSREAALSADLVAIANGSASADDKKAAMAAINLNVGWPG